MSKPTAGAVRAAKMIQSLPLRASDEQVAAIIDRETHAPELLKACKLAMAWVPCQWPIDAKDEEKCGAKGHNPVCERGKIEAAIKATEAH